MHKAGPVSVLWWVGLLRSYPYLRSSWQLVDTREGEDLFFSDVANDKLPMFLYSFKYLAMFM